MVSLHLFSVFARQATHGERLHRGMDPGLRRDDERVGEASFPLVALCSCVTVCRD
jgi:hypothetical protein